MISLGFLASNNGTSFRAVVAAVERGDLAMRPRLLVSNRAKAPALTFARDHGVETRHLATLDDPVGADARLAGVMKAANIELVLLSGYLRKLGPAMLEAYRDRILNIHPALLPRFGGEGMFGRHVHEAVIAAGERRSGASVHLVDEEYDHGAVLASASLDVAQPDDTPGEPRAPRDSARTRAFRVDAAADRGGILDPAAGRLERQVALQALWPTDRISDNTY